MMHHWLAKRGLVPVDFSSSEVSLFVQGNSEIYTPSQPPLTTMNKVSSEFSSLKGNF